MPTVQWASPKTLREALAILAAFETQATSVAWRMGMVLIAIHDFGLWKETGRHADFLAWLEDEGPCSVQHARKLVYFARVFTDEKAAATIGITRGYELILYADETGRDAQDLVMRDVVIAGRPISKHTRKSLIDATREIRLNSGLNEDPGYVDPGTGGGSWEYVAPVPSTPPERMRQGERVARRMVRWAEEEGAAGVDAVVRSWNGQPVINLRVPLDQAPMLLDSR